MANLNIKLVKSLNGRLEKHIATAKSMGLRKIGDTTVPVSYTHLDVYKRQTLRSSSARP